MQGPISHIAGGQTQAGGMLTVSAQPNSFNILQNITVVSTIDVSSISGFQGVVTLTYTDNSNFLGTGGSLSFGTTTLNVAPGSDGITYLNITSGASQTANSYNISVVASCTNATTGQTATASVLITIIVAAGIVTCVNNQDCGSGGICSNGQCYTNQDNTVIHPGPCTGASQEGRGCASKNLGGPCTFNNNCVCQQTLSNCVGFTANCQSTNGPCSKGTLLNNCGCGCSKCTGQTNPIQFICPTASQTVCVNASAPTATTAQFVASILNTDVNNGYTIGGTIQPVGQGNQCAGGNSGPSLSFSTMALPASIGFFPTITVPITCSTAKCYSWNLLITVTNALGQTVQSFTCPFTVCTTTSACFQIQVQCPGSSTWSSSCTATILTDNYSAPCPGCPNAFSSCGCDPFHYPSFQACSFNGFAGTITITCSGLQCVSGQYGCAGISSSVTLTSGQCTGIGGTQPCFNVTGCGAGHTSVPTSPSCYTVSGSSSAGSGSSATGCQIISTTVCP